MNPMNTYESLAEDGERIGRRRLRLFAALVTECATLWLVALCGLLCLLLLPWAAPPGPAWAAVALALICGLAHLVLAFRLLHFFQSDYLRARMEALPGEAALADFAMHAPCLYSAEAFGRITDAETLRALARGALCDEVRREAAARLSARGVLGEGA